jgi:DNA-directed RNA polymerase specialized sigma24 family protein
MLPPQDDSRSGYFGATPWSLIYLIRHGSPPARVDAALGRLCELYWRPIFVFIQACGYDCQDAQDLTQRFILYVIERNHFAQADRTKGRFRSYLLGTLKHFLAHVRRDEKTQKRGGGAPILSLDEAMVDGKEVPATGAGPTVTCAADHSWAQAIDRRVTDRLAAEYAEAGKSELYYALRHHLREKERGGYEEDGARLRRPVATVRSDVARLRQRYRDLVIEELRTQAPHADLTEELRHFCLLLAEW